MPMDDRTDAEQFAEQGDRDTALKLLQTLMDLHHNQAAVSKAFGLVTRWPDATEAWVALVKALFRLGEAERAMGVADRAVNAVPDPWSIFFALGVRNRSLHRAKAAEAYYRKALELCPGHQETITNLVALLLDQKRTDEALALAEEGVRADPLHPGLQFSLGRALRAQKKLNEAVTAFQAAIALAPDFVQAYTNLVDTHLLLGYPVKADVISKWAGVLAPTNAAMYHNAGLTLHDLGQFEAAAKAFRNAIALAPGDGYHYKNLSNVLAILGVTELSYQADRRAAILLPGKEALVANRMLKPQSTIAAEYDWFFRE